jgi:hypothetical protein
MLNVIAVAAIVAMIVSSLISLAMFSFLRVSTRRDVESPIDPRRQIVVEVLNQNIDTIDTFEEWADLLLKALDDEEARRG